MSDHPQPLISVVDDDLSMCMATVRLLRADGFVALGFASAEEFLTSADTAGTSCLILDLCMPEMTGVQLYRHLIAQQRFIPTIFISAQRDGPEVDEAKASGAAAFLAKPFSEEALLGAIHRALNLHG
jgi:FixJ family two-component response regulator